MDAGLAGDDKREGARVSLLRAARVGDALPSRRRRGGRARGRRKERAPDLAAEGVPGRSETRFIGGGGGGSVLACFSPSFCCLTALSRWVYKYVRSLSVSVGGGFVCGCCVSVCVFVRVFFRSLSSEVNCCCTQQGSANLCVVRPRYTFADQRDGRGKGRRLGVHTFRRLPLLHPRSKVRYIRPQFTAFYTYLVDRYITWVHLYSAASHRRREGKTHLHHTAQARAPKSTLHT